MANTKNTAFTIGQNGMTESILVKLATTLKGHELFKVKMRADKSKRQVMIKQLLETSSAKCIQIVGGILVLYKPYEKNPIITLPKI